jgi:hypothetical protein
MGRYHRHEAQAVSKFMWLNGFRVNRDELAADLVTALREVRAIEDRITALYPWVMDESPCGDLIEAITPLYKYVKGRL